MNQPHDDDQPQMPDFSRTLTNGIHNNAAESDGSGNVSQSGESIPPMPLFGARIFDVATNVYSGDIVNIVTGPRGLVIVHARVPLEQTIPLQLPTNGPNNDLIFASDAAERHGGIVSIEVTDDTQFFIGPYKNPIRLRGVEGLTAAQDFLNRDFDDLSIESE